MKFIDKVLMSSRKTVHVGLRSATQEEIQNYKDELNKHNIKFVHLTKNLPHNGILKITK